MRKAVGSRTRTRNCGCRAQEVSVSVRYVVQSRGNISITLKGLQTAERGAAHLHCLFKDRLEYRSEIAGRDIDDLQHLRGRCLLLKGLRKRALAFLTIRNVRQ